MKNHIRLSILLSWSLLWLLFFSACNVNKYISKEQAFVKETELVFTEKKDLHTSDGALDLELDKLILQKPNKKAFRFVPKQWFFYRHSEPDDTTGWDSWILKQFAESPSIYNENKAAETVSRLQNYLRNEKGYLNAAVDFETEIKKKRSYTKYRINTGKRYVYDSIRFYSQDAAIQAIMNANQAARLVRIGQPISLENYNAERKRLTRLIKDAGYATFDISYIEWNDVDTSNFRITQSTFEIKTPSDSTFHTKYNIGEIKVYKEFNYNLANDDYVLDSLQEGVYFYAAPVIPYELKNDAILDAFRLNKGQVYNLSDIEATKVQLIKMNLFKFVSIQQEISKNNPNEIDLIIKLQKDPKMSFDFELDGNITNNTYIRNASNSNSTSIGLSLNVGYENRNFFNKGEKFNVNGILGFEVPIRKEDRVAGTFNAFNGLLNTGLDIPRYIPLTHLYPKSLQENTYTAIQLGYEYQSYITQYDYHTVNIGFGYKSNPNPRTQLTWNTTGADFFYPTIFPEFEEDLVEANNLNLLKTFDNQLFTGLLFKNISWRWNSGYNKFGEKTTILANFEQSGLEALGINSAFVNQDSLRLFNVDFAYFLKIDGAAVYSRKMNDVFSVATRFSTGYILPLANQPSPYIKQFYLGGNNSMRAWQVRSLGPGRYSESENINYAVGEFMLESNVELRFDVRTLRLIPFQIALFADAGNVWNINDDFSSENDGSRLTNEFYKEIALGAGVGLRLDLSFFILRVDMAYKLRKPFADTDGNYWLREPLQETPNFSIAFGLPF